MAALWDKFEDEFLVFSDVVHHVFRDFIVHDMFFGRYARVVKAEDKSIVGT